MAEIVLFFSSNADTMIATKALKDGGVSAKMIPKPAHVSARPPGRHIGKVGGRRLDRRSGARAPHVQPHAAADVRFGPADPRDAQDPGRLAPGEVDIVRPAQIEPRAER